jgi:hypothetical protein
MVLGSSGYGVGEYQIDVYGAPASPLSVCASVCKCVQMCASVCKYQIGV